MGAGLDGDPPSAIRMLSFRSSNALLLGAMAVVIVVPEDSLPTATPDTVGEVDLGVPFIAVAGGGGLGGGVAVDLPEARVTEDAVSAASPATPSTVLSTAESLPKRSAWPPALNRSPVCVCCWLSPPFVLTATLVAAPCSKRPKAAAFDCVDWEPREGKSDIKGFGTDPAVPGAPACAEIKVHQLLA